MAAKDITIPRYTAACLAADEGNNAVYLVGVSPTIQGRLEVNYVSMIDVNAPTSSPVGSQVDTYEWSSGAPKACFIHPEKTYANRPLSVMQFGDNVSYGTLIYPNGPILVGERFALTSFVSPKLFALTGTVAPFDWFVALTTDASWPWAGVRFNFTNQDNDLLKHNLTNYPTETPLVAVGTYSTVAGPPSRGYAVVFDKLGQGQIFASTGSVTATINNTESVIVLSAPTNVQMNSIKLTEEAVPVTMTTTGYILDKAPDNSTVIYAITPETSSSLERVDIKGGSPPFSKSYAATALNKQIITYTPSVSGNPTFNSFDTATQTWSGINLITPPGPIPTPPGPIPIPPHPNVGAIVGGVIGGLLVIALLVFLFIRWRNAKRRKAAAASIANANADADKYAPVPSTGDMTQINNGGVVVPMPGQIFQGQYEQQQQQQAGYNYQPSILDPYAQVQKPDEPLYVPYQTPTKFIDPCGGNQDNGVPVNYDTTGSESGLTAYSPSLFASPVPLRSEPEHYSPVQQLQQQQHDSPVQQLQQQQHYSPVQQLQQQQHDSPVQQLQQQQHDSPVQQQQQQQHYSPVQQLQQQQHYSPVQQLQQQQHYSPVQQLQQQAHVHPVAIGAPISGDSKSPQYIPPSQ